MVNIILLGPPGSGKGTQSKFIVKNYNLLHISIGDLLRNYCINENNKLSEKINYYISRGELLDDDLIINVIKSYINKKINKNNNGFLIDGYPRNINQAYLFKKLDIKINIIIEFVIDENKLIDRLTGRLIHEKSGRIYHKKFNPPLIDGLDDITNEKLLIRKDDSIDVIRDRIKIYNNNILDIRKYFYNLCYKENINYFIVKSDIGLIFLKYVLFSILNKFIYNI